MGFSRWSKKIKTHLLHRAPNLLNELENTKFRLITRHAGDFSPSPFQGGCCCAAASA